MPATMDTPLRESFEHYLAHQEDYVREYAGRVIVLIGHDVIGVYDTVGEAVRETAKEHPLGSFLVQRVERGTGSTSTRIFSPLLMS
jgi:hypothetical protein